jgi:hypothetical protein
MNQDLTFAILLSRHLELFFLTLRLEFVNIIHVMEASKMIYILKVPMYWSGKWYGFLIDKFIER